jgi:hypothetical protein
MKQKNKSSILTILFTIVLFYTELAVASPVCIGLIATGTNMYAKGRIKIDCNAGTINVYAPTIPDITFTIGKEFSWTHEPQVKGFVEGEEISHMLVTNDGSGEMKLDLLTQELASEELEQGVIYFFEAAQKTSFFGIPFYNVLTDFGAFILIESEPIIEKASTQTSQPVRRTSAQKVSAP